MTGGRPRDSQVSSRRPSFPSNSNRPTMPNRPRGGSIRGFGVIAVTYGWFFQSTGDSHRGLTGVPTLALGRVGGNRDQCAGGEQEHGERQPASALTRAGVHGGDRMPWSELGLPVIGSPGRPVIHGAGTSGRRRAHPNRIPIVDYTSRPILTRELLSLEGGGADAHDYRIGFMPQ